jgi:hypothetical protein
LEQIAQILKEKYDQARPMGNSLTAYSTGGGGAKRRWKSLEAEEDSHNLVSSIKELDGANYFYL